MKYLKHVKHASKSNEQFLVEFMQIKKIIVSSTSIACQCELIGNKSLFIFKILVFTAYWYNYDYINNR